jgi:MFS transporter, ACS family, allantoate permease
MFMIFGLVTVIFGISLWWILPDSPLTAGFLNGRESLIAIERLEDNKTGVKNTHHKKEQVIEALKDVKVWMLAFAIFFHNMTNSLQTSFTGLILLGFGYSTYDAVLFSIPAGIVMAVTMLTVNFILATNGATISVFSSLSSATFLELYPV